MVVSLKKYPRDYGLWLTFNGRRLRVELDAYDWLNQGNGRASRGRVLRALDPATGKVVSQLNINFGTDNWPLFEPEWVKTDLNPAERLARLEDALADAFKQAVYYGWLEQREEVRLWDKGYPLRFHIEPEDLPTFDEPRFSFEKEPDYEKRISEDIQRGVLHALKTEYNTGCSLGELVSRVGLESDDVQRELARLVDNGEVTNANAATGPAADMYRITDAGARRLSELVSGRDVNQFNIMAGQEADAVRRILEILKNAKTDLLITDDYLDDKVFDLLKQIPNNVRLRLLTGGRRGAFEPSITTFRNSVRAIEARECKQCHDRFLVLDSSDVWCTGTSINGLGKKDHMIYRLTEPGARRDRVARLEQLWTAGTTL